MGPMVRPVLLTLGHGYAAARLAASLPGWRVRGTTRSVTQVRFFADDPRDVVQRVNREVSARSGGSR